MNYPTLRFVFDRKKVATKKNKGLIQIEVLLCGKRKWIGTGIKVYSDQWDNRRKVINSTDMMQLNDALDAQIHNIQDWINGLIKRNEPFDFDKLDHFLRYANKTETYIDFVERRIMERQDITESTKATHHTFVSSLREFGKIVYFSDLTIANITLYDDWLHSKGYSQPTIHNYHKRNKRYINEAIKFELLEQSPYSSLRFERGKNKPRQYLTLDEVQKIERAIIAHKALCRVRDLFVFQCYTGISYADLSKFDFRNDLIRKGDKYIIRDCRVKTDEPYFIVLLSPAVRILEKYDFVLPVISNQQYNMRLKIVADYAGIEKNLTVHLARHTFATICLSKGVRIENVSKMLGHTNIKTTQIYAKVLNDDLEKDFEMLESVL